MATDPNGNGSKKRPVSMLGAGLVIGIGVGVALGVALDNTGVGIALGVAGAPRCPETPPRSQRGI